MKLNSLFTIPLLFLFFIQLNAQDYHVRIATMGNSITAGAGLLNPAVESYPAQLQQQLNEIYGDTCIVQNCGVSGRTMLKKGDFPLWDERLFTEGFYAAPDIVFILLGTNDSKPYNWDDYGNEFYADYQSMIDTFKTRNPNCKFIVSYPPPAYQVVWDIRDSVIVNGVIPVIDQILENNEAELVDFYTPLVDSVHLFPDFIHPSVEGSGIMAKLIFNKIVESDIIHSVAPGNAYITNITTSNKLIPMGSDVTITWTSRNADSVYFDNMLVENEGSVMLNPLESTEYTLKAFGPNNTDVLTFNQDVYVVELAKIKSKVAKSKINTGDTVGITLFFSDQYNRSITNEEYNVVWEIIEGNGELINETSFTAQFVGTTQGVSKVKMSVGGITNEAKVTVENKTSVNAIDNKSFVLFPNPAKHIIFVEGAENNSRYNVFSLNGTKLQSGQIENGNIQLGSIAAGTYIVEIISDSKTEKQKIVVY